MGAINPYVPASWPNNPIELMRRVIDKMHLKEITIAYGMTTSPFLAKPTNSLLLEKQGGNRGGTAKLGSQNH